MHSNNILAEVTRTLQNPYSVLGVHEKASQDEIKAAYRRLALQYHPDRNPGDSEAEARFKEISEAYATLRDPKLRARVDRYGTVRPEAARPNFETVDWQTIFNEADININWQAGTPRTGHAVFDALFGMMTGMMRGSGLLPGEHREAAVEVTLEEARSGVERRVRIPGPSVCPQCRGARLVQSRTCMRCGGRGVLRGGAEVDVTVPPHTRHGVKLRLRGLGGPGQPPGDAFVAVWVRLPRGVKLVGRDVHVELPINSLEARHGTTLTLHGVTVPIPSGARDRQTLRVRGGGLAGGDMLVTLRLAFWPALGRKLMEVTRGALARV